MHRTKTKRLTPEASLLKKLREQRGLSMRDASELAKKSVAWISHVENGRMDLSADHLKALLPLYGQTEKSFRAYLGGTAFVESPARRECIDAVHDLPDNIIDSLHPLLLSLKGLQKETPK